MVENHTLGHLEGIDLLIAQTLEIPLPIRSDLLLKN